MKKTQKIEIKLFLPADEVKRTGGRIAAVNFLYNAWNESAGLITLAIQNQIQEQGVTGDNIELFKSLFPITDNATLATQFNITKSIVRHLGFKWSLKKNYRVWPLKDEIMVMKHYDTLDPESLGKRLSIPRSKWAVIKKHGELAGKERKEENEIITMLKTDQNDIQTQRSDL